MKCVEASDQDNDIGLRLAVRLVRGGHINGTLLGNLGKAKYLSQHHQKLMQRVYMQQTLARCFDQISSDQLESIDIQNTATRKRRNLSPSPFLSARTDR
ncbi:MAG TPA: hypothetical protein VGL53_06155 [Bryobacteraceae bacterium]